MPVDPAYLDRAALALGEKVRLLRERKGQLACALEVHPIVLVDPDIPLPGDWH